MNKGQEWDMEEYFECPWSCCTNIQTSFATLSLHQQVVSCVVGIIAVMIDNQMELLKIYNPHQLSCILQLSLYLHNYNICFFCLGL
jgi:hypothetical protein